MVAALLSELETAALRLYPAWLPPAKDIAGPGGAAVPAVRALARAMADPDPYPDSDLGPGPGTGTGTDPRLAPFLADLAELALRGTVRPDDIAAGVPGAHSRGAAARVGTDRRRAERSRLSTRFPPQTRAAGLARVLAAAYGRPRTSLVVHVPDGLTGGEEESLVAGCEWLARRAGLAIWLTGAPLPTVDRVPVATVLPDPPVLPDSHVRPDSHVLPDPRAVSDPKVTSGPGSRVGRTDASGRSDRDRTRSARTPSGGPAAHRPDPAFAVTRPALGHPPVANVPHPASRAERALEAALAACDWASGRAWNRPYRSHALANPIRVDLMWPAERCVVEIDGPDHRSHDKFAADHRRDVQLQLDGYAVLRFTNDQVLADTGIVVDQLRRFLQKRRADGRKGP
jgi:very-short-patch-repair endonuclease